MNQGIYVTIFLVAQLVASRASTQQAHKCIKDGEVSYQSAPCSGTQRTVRTWEVRQEPPPSSVAPLRRKVETTLAPSRAKPRVAARRPQRDSTSIADKRCAAAKERRRTKLESVGLKRTFDLLRKLDDAVQSACALSI